MPGTQSCGTGLNVLFSSQDSNSAWFSPPSTQQIADATDLPLILFGVATWGFRALHASQFPPDAGAVAWTCARPRLTLPPSFAQIQIDSGNSTCPGLLKVARRAANPRVASEDPCHLGESPQYLNQLFGRRPSL